MARTALALLGGSTGKEEAVELQILTDMGVITMRGMYIPTRTYDWGAPVPEMFRPASST